MALQWTKTFLNSEIAVEILNEYGFLVDTAEDGAEAVEKVKNSTAAGYDLVLMDVQMPVMNGYEATKQICALEDPKLAGITILAMTANAFEEDRKKALECGMDGFLSKPIVIKDLIDALQHNLERVQYSKNQTKKETMRYGTRKLFNRIQQFNW